MDAAYTGNLGTLTLIYGNMKPVNGY